MNILQLSFKSLWHRRSSAFLVLVVVSLSVTLLLGVQRLRQEARLSFSRSIAGTDLIVGARSGSLNLLLYSIFRIGNPTNNISWQSYQAIREHPNVAWTIPLALGDSHRGFRLIGTDEHYFEHYRYGRQLPLSFAKGGPFSSVYDVVLGADVAQNLGYELGQQITMSHGTAEVSLIKHGDKPFTIVGVLKKTGTAVDKSLHISLAGLEAMHVGWEGGVPIPSLSLSAEAALQQDLTPKVISAFLLG
ncbi:MAG: ABC transporter permease [Deinococcales bacterium]